MNRNKTSFTRFHRRGYNLQLESSQHNNPSRDAIVYTPYIRVPQSDPETEGKESEAHRPLH
jgi:hypothetical protein